MDSDPPRRPGQKTLHAWSKPLDADGQGAESHNGPGAASPDRPRIRDAIAMIKKEDFLNIASTPCARQGYLTGIGAGAGVGLLKFIIQGKPSKAANWAVATFVLGSAVSYEVCQYKRRAERAQMKRSIEIVTEGRREKARQAAEARRIAAEESRKAEEASREQLRLEEERVKAARKPWYKPW